MMEFDDQWVDLREKNAASPDYLDLSTINPVVIWKLYPQDLGSALASLSVEARNYFLNKPNLQKLFPKSTLKWETIRNYFLKKPSLQKLFLKSTQFTETIS